jgi:hypothetical protein
MRMLLLVADVMVAVPDTEGRMEVLCGATQGITDGMKLASMLFQSEA